MNEILDWYERHQVDSPLGEQTRKDFREKIEERMGICKKLFNMMKEGVDEDGAQFVLRKISRSDRGSTTE